MLQFCGVVSMATIEQIRTDIERLDQFGKERVFAWLKTTLTPLFESKSIFHEVNERKLIKDFAAFTVE